MPGPLFPPSPTRERAWIFALLVVPMAVISSGLVNGGLSFLLTRQGVGMAQSSGIISLLTLPMAIYFLWSPLTDFFVERKTWVILGAVAAGAAMVVTFYRPSLASPTAVALLFLSACLGQLVISACGGIMGTLRTEVTRRRAASFYQGGSMGLGALALFAIVALGKRMPESSLGWVIAAMIALPAVFAFAAPRQEKITAEGAGQIFARIGREFKDTFFRWKAVPYLTLMLFPMGSGAAIGLLPGLAADYGVSAIHVAWLNGLGGAALTAAGAFAVALLRATKRASITYLSVCILNEFTLVILWLAPLHPATYYVGTTLFLFTMGSANALFTAVILEFLGHSGKSGSSRYSIINGLGNLPVAYMSAIDGFGYGRWGARGLCGTDFIVGTIGGSLLLAHFLMHRHDHDAPAVVAIQAAEAEA
jgi:PAT family beta-lactamase induction signal transducer AmpG